MNDEYKLGFEEQEDTYSCGAYAFSHAALLLGKPLTLTESKKLCKTVSYWKSIKDELERIEIISDVFGSFRRIWEAVGTDEKGIIAGVKKVGFKPAVIYTESENQAFTYIKEKAGSPIILHINSYSEGGHWVTCAGWKDNRFIIIDSLPERKQIIVYYTWKELMKRFLWNGDYFSCFGIVVESKSPISCIKNFHDIVQRLKKDEYLRKWWGYYLADLVEIFNASAKQKASSLLKKSYEDIIAENSYWIYDVNKADVISELDNYIFIADAYDLRGDEKSIISFVTAFTAGLILEFQ